MPGYTVSDLVAEFLAAMEVHTAFGIASVHNVPMLDAVSRRNSLRFVSSRGEMGGGHMADAFARVSGDIGLLISSTGPGCANAIPALVEARFAGTPLLHITGRIATPFLGRDTGTVHDVPGQSQMVAAAGKAAFQVRRPEEALGVLIAAVTTMLTPPAGPVTVEIPIDLQKAKVDRPATLDTLRRPEPPAVAPSEAALDGLVEAARASRRPMLWLGNGACGCASAAKRLLSLGFGAVTSWNGRGIVPEDHPATLGALHGSGTPRIEAFYDTVDLMIVAGSRLRGHETMDGGLRLPAHRAQIDVDPRAAGRTYTSDRFIHADAALTLHALADRLEADGYRAEPALQTDLATARSEARRDYRATLGPYADFADQLRASMPRDAVFVRDATVAANTWGHRLFEVYGREQSVHSVGAAIGLGLPFGIGAAFAASARGRKTVALVGDGGFALSLNELWVAVQDRLDLTIIVMNDGLYAAIGHIQDAVAEGRRNHIDILVPDLAKLADAAGIPSYRVTSADSFGAVIGEALKSGGPGIVDVDMRTIGHAPAYSSWGGGPGSRAAG